MDIIEFLKTIVFGIIQGITEWLPISSTGHMILAEELIKLNCRKEFWELFLVVIQFGSILAVVLMFFNKLNPFSAKKTRTEKNNTFSLWLKILVACIPAGIIGILFDEQINKIFYNPTTVAITLIIYGIIFIIIEKSNIKAKISDFNHLDYRTALLIGAFQVLALIPGTSRSGATIVGALILGTSRYVAAEFSFFLAVPVMLGASGVKLLKFFMDGLSFTGAELGILLLGMAVAFIVSIFAIKFLLGYIRKHDFKPFGYYRIVLGILVLLYFFVIK